MSDYIEKKLQGDLFGPRMVKAPLKKEFMPEGRAWGTMRFLLRCVAMMQRRGISDDGIERFFSANFLHLWRPTVLFGAGREIKPSDVDGLAEAIRMMNHSTRLRFEGLPEPKSDALLEEQFLELWSRRGK